MRIGNLVEQGLNETIKFYSRNTYELPKGLENMKLFEQFSFSSTLVLVSGIVAGVFFAKKAYDSDTAAQRICHIATSLLAFEIATYDILQDFVDLSGW
ncbi:MAG: hypothetical protein K1000chlam3_00062 [Chlamydiae bacterium]|nr:hypothetical protein [Chlamydiota bacterium]